MKDYFAWARTVKERKGQENQSGYSSECTRDLAHVVFYKYISYKARITPPRSTQNLVFDITVGPNSLFTPNSEELQVLMLKKNQPTKTVASSSTSRKLPHSSEVRILRPHMQENISAGAQGTPKPQGQSPQEQGILKILPSSCFRCGVPSFPNRQVLCLHSLPKYPLSKAKKILYIWKILFIPQN